MCEFKEYRVDPETLYTKKILADKPLEIQSNDFLDKLYERVNKKERKTLKVVHMSDLHLDLRYAEGSLKQCDSVICCRAHYGFPKNPKL